MYQEAGAAVLYAPGLTTEEQIAAVVSSVDRPVNVLMALQGVELSVADCRDRREAHQCRSALARCALTGLFRGAREMKSTAHFVCMTNAETLARSIPFRVEERN
jgi:hypothetical protein